MLKYSLTCLLLLNLSACATMIDSKEKRIAICKELRSQIVFSGSNSDNRIPDNTQYSDEALAQRNYNTYDCDRVLSQTAT